LTLEALEFTIEGLALALIYLDSSYISAWFENKFNLQINKIYAVTSTFSCSIYLRKMVPAAKASNT